MHNLLRSRRGSVAFATVVALVPLIGVVALGGEAGSWYVTKQHAQNAADVAAISGALRLKCDIDALKSGQACTDTNSVDYRAKQFAAQNGFCNTGDTSYPGSRCVTTLPTGISQSVSVAVGTDEVRATVTQQQPAYLAAVLGMSTVNIPATAVAQIQILTKPCILALSGSVSFQGSVTVSSPNCGIASNSTASNSFDFTGNGGLDINAPSFAAGGCSQTGGNQCNGVTQHARPVPNPLSGLDSAMASLTTADFSGGVCTNPDAKGKLQPALKAYSATTTLTTGPCYNTVSPPDNSTLNGTYFFNGTVDIQSVSGTATLILFGNGAQISKITGSPTINLTGLKDHPELPPPLSSDTVRNLMTGLVIYDPETTSGSRTVDISGNSNIFFNGTVYAPNANVTYGGNSSVSTPGCFQLIAAAVTFFGNAKLDQSGCALGTPQPQVQYVRLVQ